MEKSQYNKKILNRKMKPKELIIIKCFLDNVPGKIFNQYYVVYTNRKGRFVNIMRRKYYLDSDNSVEIHTRTI